MAKAKTFIPFLILIAVLVGGFFLLKNGDHVSAPTGIDLSPNVDAQQLCYIWNTEAGDRAMLSMDIRGEDVIGELYFLPAEKDSKTGIFAGKVISLSSVQGKSVITAIWEAKGEGVTNKEELWIAVDGSIAAPGFGEMKDRGDGVYVYADPENIYYGPNLQQTDCGDEAMD